MYSDSANVFFIKENFIRAYKIVKYKIIILYIKLHRKL